MSKKTSSQASTTDRTPPSKQPPKHQQKPNPGADSKPQSVHLPRTKVILGRDEILGDYLTGYRSRFASLAGRKEVLTGKAKFGIFGDGKELPQLAMAKAFLQGDFRSGYYRDQTFMLAAGMTTLEAFFAQLYADTDKQNEPASSGRMMNAHFATPLINPDGSYVDALSRKNSSADISPTAGQMARALGIAYASKLYRLEPALESEGAGFSRKGNEISFATIGDASTSEGIFFESINAAGVLQAPLITSVWDDGYGISVPRELQTTRGSISAALGGMASDREGEGFIIETVKAWDYPSLVDTYIAVAMQVRRTHKPALIHVMECTQPQGHSTSGSHERYKSETRLQWEKEACCLGRMRAWILESGLADATTLDALEDQAKTEVEAARKMAWTRFQEPIVTLCAEAERVIAETRCEMDQGDPALSEVDDFALSLQRARQTTLYRRQVQSILHRVQFAVAHLPPQKRLPLDNLLRRMRTDHHIRFNSHLVSESAASPLNSTHVPPMYGDAAQGDGVDGRLVLKACFEHHFTHNPRFYFSFQPE